MEYKTEMENFDARLHEIKKGYHYHQVKWTALRTVAILLSWDFSAFADNVRRTTIIAEHIKETECIDPFDIIALIDGCEALEQFLKMYDVFEEDNFLRKTVKNAVEKFKYVA
jgi:hypothetical protein